MTANIRENTGKVTLNQAPENEIGDVGDEWEDEANLNETATGVSKKILQITRTVCGVQISIKFSVGARRANLSLTDGTKPLRRLVPPLNKAYALEGVARRSRPHARHRAPQLPWA